MPPRASMTAEVHRQLGELAATQVAQGAHLERMDDTLREDRRVASEDRRLMLAKLDELSERLGKMEPDGLPLPLRLKELETEATASKLFRSRVGAVVGLAGSAAGLLLAGLGYLLNHFWADLVSLLSRLLPRP
ncbi:hypothetical protein V5F79_00945 [Xanthobacter flavus]|uniref:hypothetical protein n=1 Tax=Xanthobacter flavus TaxID=281 RepID=UPI00372CBDAE